MSWELWYTVIPGIEHGRTLERKKKWKNNNGAINLNDDAKLMVKGVAF